MEPRSLPEKAHPFCLHCRREVPPKPGMAVIVTKDGSLVGYLHEFMCRERWQETHQGHVYEAVPKDQSNIQWFLM
jgi:hypothetical protein